MAGNSAGPASVLSPSFVFDKIPGSSSVPKIFNPGTAPNSTFDFISGGSHKEGDEGYKQGYYDPNTFYEFSQTGQAQKHSDTIEKIKGAPLYQGSRGDSHAATRYGNIDTTGLMSDYNAWLQAQASSETHRDQYRTLAAQQQGRDATILTGPGATTILGR